MPAGHGSTDPTTGIYTYGELDVAGAGAGGLFSDFLNFLATTVKTAVGSILTRLTALELGATLQFTGAITVANTASADLTYDAGDIANTLAGALSITRSTGKFVCAKAGTWEFSVDCRWVANTTGARSSFLQYATAAAPAVFTNTDIVANPAVSPATPGNHFARYILPLAVGDVVKIGVTQNSGGNLNLIKAHLRIKQLA